MSTLKEKNKIGFTCSAFDLFHAGHVAMLKEARSVCDYLIVGLQTDPTIDRPDKNKPLQSIAERYLQVQGCKYVDEIIPYESEEDLLRLMQLVQFDVRIIGEEYREKDFTGKDYQLDNYVEVYYNSRHHNLSSTNLRHKIGIKNDNNNYPNRKES